MMRGGIMQGLSTDWFNPKRIRTINKVKSLRKVALENSAAAVAAAHDRAAIHPGQNQAAAPRVAVSHAPLPAGGLQARVYDGVMTIGGNVNAGSGQTGIWSGTMTDEIIMSVNQYGTGSAGETLDGNITLTVHNPDGTQKSSTAPLDLWVPLFTIQDGKFNYTDSSGFDFSSLIGSVNVQGLFAGSQSTLLEYLSIPFSGFVNGTTVSGTIRGKGLLNTQAIAIGGAIANQRTGGPISPFNTLSITDFNDATVTATVTLSKAGNGTLSNLGGGTYSKSLGTYTVSGSAATVNAALKGLVFTPGKLTSPNSQVTTSFNLSVKDSQGGSMSNGTTSVVAVNPVSLSGFAKYAYTKGTRAVTLFPNAVVTNILQGPQDDVVKVTLSDPKNGVLESKAGGSYNKKSGVFTVRGSGYAVTMAMEGLKFVPTASSTKVVTTLTIAVTDSIGSATTKTQVTVNPATPALVSMGDGMFSYTTGGVSMPPLLVVGSSGGSTTTVSMGDGYFATSAGTAGSSTSVVALSAGGGLTVTRSTAPAVGLFIQHVAHGLFPAAAHHAASLPAHTDHGANGHLSLAPSHS